MKVNPWFYVSHLLSILAFEFLGYMILSRFGTSWLPYITAAVCFTTAQVNAFLVYTRYFLAFWERVLGPLIWGVCRRSALNWENLFEMILELPFIV